MITNSCTQLSRPLKTNESAAERKVVELTKTIKGKEEKIKGYRNMVVKLKEEFIKLEEERAVNALRDKSKDKDRDRDRYHVDERLYDTSSFNYHLLI